LHEGKFEKIPDVDVSFKIYMSADLVYWNKERETSGQRGPEALRIDFQQQRCERTEIKSARFGKAEGRGKESFRSTQGVERRSLANQIQKGAMRGKDFQGQRMETENATGNLEEGTYEGKEAGVGTKMNRFDNCSLNSNRYTHLDYASVRR